MVQCWILKKKFRICKSNNFEGNNFKNFLQAKIDYKVELQEEKSICNNNLKKKLTNLHSHKDFWKTVKSLSHKNYKISNITKSQWFEYFKE